MPNSVISIHGINTRGVWTKWINAPLQRAGFIHHIVDYGHLEHLRGLNFMFLAGARDKALEWFVKEYRALVGARERPHVIAHSFGSWIVGMAMVNYPELRFGRLILIGSVLPREFPWVECHRREQFVSVLNERGVSDKWPAIASRVSRALGDAGKGGFTIDDDNRGFVSNRTNRFKHSTALYEARVESSWIPLLHTAFSNLPPPELVPERFWRYLRYDAPDSNHRYSEVSLRGRVDHRGTYFGHYRRAGVCSKVGGVSTSIRVFTAADTSVPFGELRTRAIDRRHAGALLRVSSAEDDEFLKTFEIHLDNPIASNDSFDIEWRQRWPSAIRFDAPNGDYIRTPFADQHPRLQFCHNVPVTLSRPGFYRVQDGVFKEECATTVTRERDGTLTYKTTVAHARPDGYVFWHHGQIPGADLTIAAEETTVALKDGRGLTIRRAEETEIWSIAALEQQLEGPMAASREVLHERLRMFHDGFLVALCEGKIAGYCASSLWTPFTFETFEDIADFPLHFDVHGTHLLAIFVGVDSTMRRQGVGSALVDALRNVAVVYHATAMHFVARPELQGFYERSGFKVARLLPTYLSGQPGVLMEAALKRRT